jgi:hypothetical protein
VFMQKMNITYRDGIPSQMQADCVIVEFNTGGCLLVKQVQVWCDLR